MHHDTGILLRCCIAALALAAGPVAAQSLSKLDQDRGRTMLAQVRSDVEKHYYDPTFRGLDLAARFSAADQRIRQASTIEEIFASVAQVVLELNDSHTYFVPPALTVQVKYGWQMQMVGDSCFVTQVTQGSDAAGQGLRAGDVVISVNGQSPTRKTLWKLLYLYHLLRPQPGLRVLVRSPGEEPRQIDIAAKVRQTSRVIDLTGADGGTDLWILIREAEKEAREQWALYNEIGETVLTWKLAVFDDYDRSVEAGIKRARGRQALILDLRGNGGGDESALLALVGSFFKTDVAIGNLRRRSGAEPLKAKGSGDKAYLGKLVVLVDSESGSASEVFARTIQITRRGTVIGDRTAGAVMRSRTFGHLAGQERAIYYATSVADATVTLSDGGTLEGEGVTPDELLLPSSQDITAGRDPVLSRAAALVGVAITAEEAGRLTRQP
ncbi:MAG: PDZ domain-containing protein [Gemmatimonadaceae bacterium]|nr:PDZ domain-containing protein [Gemmatimonadaceae bacterium]